MNFGTSLRLIKFYSTSMLMGVLATIHKTDAKRITFDYMLDDGKQSVLALTVIVSLDVDPRAYINRYGSYHPLEN